MIILIGGASHTGKTNLAQRLLEKYKYPYLSIDHLKMGLIRSGNTELTPMSDDTELTEYLWNIVREMIKTAVGNEQNTNGNYNKYFNIIKRLNQPEEPFIFKIFKKCKAFYTHSQTRL